MDKPTTPQQLLPAPAFDGEACWVSDKRLAGALTLAMVAALLRPIVENWRATPRDSFPFSYYPMFSLKRSPRTRVTYLVGIDSQGGRRPLPYRCAGQGGLNQVRRQINRAVREEWADQLCEAVAASPLLARPGSLAGVVEVRIVTGEYRWHDYFSGNDKAPLTERMLASCRVRRVIA